ncbi:hypothetical protein H2248_012105 [Termitomyces sp. 'cryptogamus']|nr:hypothetical protein H2248_012105 [Termitomyces sp. 'cryptogamus']
MSYRVSGSTVSLIGNNFTIASDPSYLPLHPPGPSSNSNTTRLIDKVPFVPRGPEVPAPGTYILLSKYNK